MESPNWSELMLVVENERSELARSEAKQEENVLLNENDNEAEIPENEKFITERKRKKHHSGPRKAKKVCSFEDVTYEMVSNLSDKALVDRYALLTADEMNKKYFYKCRLFPKKCEKSYESYGNESKALQFIKAHLKEHVSELKAQSKETTPSTSAIISEVIDILKRPKKVSKTVVKHKNANKRIKLHQQVSSNVNESCTAKKGLNFSCSLNSSSENTKNIKTESSFPFSYIFAKPAVHIRDFITPILPEMTISAKKEEPCFSENNSFTVPDMSENSCTVKNENNETNFKDMNDDFMSRPDWTICHDHRYMTADTLKCIKHPLEKKKNTNLTLEKMMEINLFPEQFVVKTPVFPHIHIPYSITVSEIKELTEDGIPVVHGRLEGPNQYPPYVEDMKVKKVFQLSAKKRSFLLSEKQDVTGQVLECVENRANIKSNAAESVSKNLQEFVNIDLEEGDENAENLQKSQAEQEKEQALKFIAKLNARKKKKIKGPLSCEICKKKFTAPATLMHHYRSHARLKDYKCSQCSAEFTRQHSLKYHDMIHSGKSRFSCPHCIRKFRHPSHFKEHLRRHTGETPFYCKDCNSHFKTRNTFKRHLRAKHSKVLSADGIQEAVTSNN